MIVVESSVQCEGCTHREAGAEHPSTWPALTVGAVTRRYCSTVCLLAALSQDLAPAEPPRLPLGLTQIDVRILELVACGHSNKECAVLLNRRPATVKNRLTHVLSVLGAQDRTQAILAAHAARIINVHQLAAQFVRERDL